MVMDRRLKADYDSLNAIKLNETVSILSDPNLFNGVNLRDTFVERNSVNRSPISPSFGSEASKTSFSPSVNWEGDLHEDFDFSDVVLKYINQMLMEEDIEEKSCMFQECAALQAAEKSFYDVLVEKEPSSLDYGPTTLSDNTHSRSPDEIDVGEHVDHSYSSSFSFPALGYDVSDHEGPLSRSIVVNLDSYSGSQSFYSPSSSTSNMVDGFVDSPVSILSVSDAIGDSHPDKGVVEAKKFLPSRNGISGDTGNCGLLSKDQNKELNGLVVKVVEKNENKYHEESRGKKNPYSKDVLEEGRNYKHSAVYSEPTVRSKDFDDVLLCGGDVREPSESEILQNRVDTKITQLKAQSKGSNGGKSRGKKQGGKRDMVDLRALLSLCAQSVAANDRRSATDLLNQIRQHSSPTGDGMQRLAHYFSAGLEARMAGSGTQIYKVLISLPTSAADILKAYHLYLSSCPFRKASNFFSNKTIEMIAENKTRLHIIDFGILYGFQWPCLIQRLSGRVGGPPSLKITGIDFPCPGFRPKERVEETGRRLANYAETFNVPFEFNAIAQKWETIKPEDLQIAKDETVVVSCAFRFRNLLDETVIADSPRSKVLNLIRKINPDVFIQGIVNGAYNAPFFITRFREALFHFSSMFDMLEANVPRENVERMLLEKTIWGREAMNVIACEGGERIERPETYKQWQVRNLRAGFRQLPLNRDIMRMVKDRARTGYHKDFVIDEDGQWMLQGWKGRIVYAIASWVPAH